MFRMAVTASQLGILIRNCAVQFGHIEHLRGNIGMAGGTAVGHHSGFPWRSMTCVTFGNLGVGGHTAVSLA